MDFEGVWVVDFGGQYNQLIARRVREAHVYAEIVPYEKALERVAAARGAVGACHDGADGDGVRGAAGVLEGKAGGKSADGVADVGDDAGEGSLDAAVTLPMGMIFTGGPNSVYEDGAPTLPASFFELGIPMLGICYGAQLMAHALGGEVVSPDFKEYGKVELFQSGEVARGSDRSASGGCVRSADDDGVEGTDDGGVHTVGGGSGSGPDSDALCSPDNRQNACAVARSLQGEAASELFYNIKDGQHCWMSHTDYIARVPEGFAVTSFTAHCPTASMEDGARKLYGVQFHPEVHHTPFGQALLENFLYRVCGCKGDWTMANFAASKIAEIRSRVGDAKVLCALSGGVDSSVAAVLTHEAIGDKLTCVFVDHGLLRKGEADQVMEVYGKQFNMRIIRVDAAERFLAKLAGVDDPERKRKIIGNEFIAVFEEEAEKLMAEDASVDVGVAAGIGAGGASASGAGRKFVDANVSVRGVGGESTKAGGKSAGASGSEARGDSADASGSEVSSDSAGVSDSEVSSDSADANGGSAGIKFLLQGTIYPDVVESGGGGGGAAVIKSHHNVGGLPAEMGLELLEPLRLLFKDEVRAVGEELGIAPALVWRQPFPGPGLAIRCLGEITPEKLEIIRESDAILREEIDAYNEALFAKTGKRNYGAAHGGDDSARAVWQYFTILPNIRSVGVMGDARTYDYAVGVRAVTSVDGMTSDWARLPYDILETIATRIVNEVPGVNRVLYDLTSKPPGTIEWE